jgi:PAS domain S-box-containing protein
MFLERSAKGVGSGASGVRLPSGDAPKLLLVALAYFTVAYFGLQLASINPSATPIWPATGLAIAVVLLWGHRIALSIFIAAFIVNYLTAGSVLTSAAIALGNTLEALATAYFVNRWTDGDRVFESPAGVGKFALIVVVTATISATLGVGSLLLAGYAEAGSAASVWLTWWLGDLSGAVVITPVILLWTLSLRRSLPLNEWTQIATVYFGAVIVGVIAFSPLILQSSLREPLGFLAILPLLWAALRLGPRDTATVAAILGAFAVWGTVMHGGPFARAALNESFLLLLMFMISTTVPSLALSADVTARRRMEERLRDSEARYRGIFQSARVAVWEEDFSSVADMLDELRREGIEDLRSYFDTRPDRLSEAIARVSINDVNNYAVELFEADGKEALLGSLAAVFLPETRPIFIEELVTLWEGRRRFESETVLRTLKGHRLDAIFTMAFDGSRYERTIVSILDVTARKTAELAAEHLAAVVESSTDAIISKDLNGVITSWNPGAERLFGYTAQEAIGQPITLLFPADRLDEEVDIVARIRRGERVDHYDTVRRKKSGRLVDISLTVSPVRDANGRIVGASKIARDITEQKRAQEGQKLVVNEMKHRIKNSMATIQAIATQTLSRNVYERDAFIARLHALARAHDMLTPEAWEGAYLSAVVNQAIEPFQQAHRERISIDVPGHFWLESSKGVMVAMVMHELATNAVKHGALANGSGRVSITWVRNSEPNRVKLTWEERGGPEVRPPKSKGFGSHLIERAFGGQLGAAQLTFNPAGLTCTLEIAL